jgi:hypothetical protein
VQDHVLPEDEPAARYVDAFERLRDPSHSRAFNESEWRSMFNAAGLTVEHTERIRKRHLFVSWTARQACPADVVLQLQMMVQEAPAAAAEWLQPRDFGSPQATFTNHHIIIAGRTAAH